MDASKPHFVIGRMIHCLIFEPETFESRFYVTPKGMRRNSSEWEEAVEQYGMEYIVHDKEAKDAYENAPFILENLRARPKLMTAISGGWGEIGVFWKDPATGCRCKAGIDYLKPMDDGALLVTDTKTTTDASAYRFAYDLGEYGYIRQAAFFTDGVH